MKKAKSDIAGGRAGVTAAEIEELRINRLRRVISSALQELADESAPEFRTLALKRLVGAAIDACACVMEARRKSPGLAESLAAGLTHWPVLYSVFPGEPEALMEYMGQLGLGRSAPIATKKWRLKAPGTRWAYAYWCLVSECKIYRGIYGALPPAVDGEVHLLRGSALAKDAEEALSLPPLSRRSVDLLAWEAAFKRHLERHFPSGTVLDHPEWKKYFGKTKLDSIGRRKAKMLEMVAKGFRAIAPQARDVLLFA